MLLTVALNLQGVEGQNIHAGKNIHFRLDNVGEKKIIKIDNFLKHS